MKVVFFHLPPRKQRPEVAKSQIPAVPCQEANGLQGTGMAPCSQLPVLRGLFPGVCSVCQGTGAVHPFEPGWELLHSSEQAGRAS